VAYRYDNKCQQYVNLLETLYYRPASFRYAGRDQLVIYAMLSTQTASFHRKYRYIYCTRLRLYTEACSCFCEFH